MRLTTSKLTRNLQIVKLELSADYDKNLRIFLRLKIKFSKILDSIKKLE